MGGRELCSLAQRANRWDKNGQESLHPIRDKAPSHMNNQLEVACKGIRRNYNFSPKASRNKPVRDSRREPKHKHSGIHLTNDWINCQFPFRIIMPNFHNHQWNLMNMGCSTALWALITKTTKTIDLGSPHNKMYIEWIAWIKTTETDPLNNRTLAVALLWTRKPSMVPAHRQIINVPQDRRSITTTPWPITMYVVKTMQQMQLQIEHLTQKQKRPA